MARNNISPIFYTIKYLQDLIPHLKKNNTNMAYSLRKSCFTLSALLTQPTCQALLKFFFTSIWAHKPLQCTESASEKVLVTLNL